MTYQSTPYTVAYLASAASLIALTVYLPVRFRDDIDDPLLVLLVGITALGGFWSLASGIQIASTSLSAKVLWARASFVGVLIPPLWVLFALLYTRRTDWVTRWTVAALFSVPTGIAALILFAGPQNTIWATYSVVDNGSFLVLRATVRDWYAPVILYLYGLVVLGIVVLYRWLYRSAEVYRGQAIALAVGAIAPTAANAAYFAGIAPHPHVDITPLGFAVSGVAFTYAVVSRRLLDVVPVARERAIESMREAYLVLDDEGRVVDTNPAAREIAAVDDPVGEPFEAVLPPCPPVDEVIDDPGPTTVDAGDDDPRWFDVQASTVGDGAGTLLLLRDVTERERREAELRRTNERLEAFAQTVSHDLRNPLTVARGYAEVAADDPSPEAIAEIETALDRMDAIIGDVLTLARGEGEVETTERIDLADLARRAWGTVDTGDATLEIADDRTILADPDRARRAVENLIRNAVEHGGSDVTVEVGTVPDGFYVADDGSGFPEGTDDELLEAGHTTARDGTGLGLAIVQDIADAHGWTVELGESDGGGARVTFRGVESP